MNQQEFAGLFHVGEVIASGGPSNRANAAKLRILSIDDAFVRYQALKSQSRNKFSYDYLQVVLDGFDRIDPASIQKSIQQVFIDAGLPKNDSTENYTYGFAKEYLQRKAKLNEIVTSSGEFTRLPSGKSTLWEGNLATVQVDRRERNREAVMLCKKMHGVLCIACGFDFEAFYGPVGKGYIHVHHLTPLAQSSGQQSIDPEKDLVPLCPNCHAMIHHKTLRTVDELKALIEEARTSNTNIRASHIR